MGEGLVGDARSLAANGVRMLHTRLELFAIEAQAEKARLARQLLVACATLFFLSFGAMLALVSAALSLPDGARVAVLVALAIVFLAAGVAGAAWLARPAREIPFAGTLATLREDERALAGGADD